jgi:hypothetical protein
MISLLLRMSTTILLSCSRKLTELSWSSQFLVKNKYAGPGKVTITGASNGGKLNLASFFLSGTHLTTMKYLGFLVCGSVVRAPEGTFGAAIAEGGVADLLKVIGLPHNVLSFFNP